ncbi:MAG: reverse transcriptase domain-containing protein [Bacteroidia bacterium]
MRRTCRATCTRSGAAWHPDSPARGEAKSRRTAGGTRTLGIPTIGDRVAQMVVKMHIEPGIDPMFHDGSFGYRPGRSQHGALDRVKSNCRMLGWAIDLDIKAFFDEIDHGLLMRALARRTTEKWVLMYVRRWLTAPMARLDGTLVERKAGTPQGGVISPLLANLFLHYALDKWMDTSLPELPFVRYADDIVVHCRTEAEARSALGTIRARLGACKLRLHPDKTRIVHCKRGRSTDPAHTSPSTSSASRSSPESSGKRRPGRHSWGCPVLSRKSFIRMIRP